MENGLDESVVGNGHGLQAGGQRFDSLVVTGIDAEGFRCVQDFQRSGERHRMLRPVVWPLHTVIPALRALAGEVLPESPAKAGVDQLQAPADAKNGFFQIHKLLQHGGLHPVTGGTHLSAASQHLLPV